jgi:hypothetical protein
MNGILARIQEGDWSIFYLLPLASNGPLLIGSKWRWKPVLREATPAHGQQHNYQQEICMRLQTWCLNPPSSEIPLAGMLTHERGWASRCTTSPSLGEEEEWQRTGKR